MSDPKLTFAQRAEHRAARLVLSMPPALQYRLMRQGPIVRDGLTLDPEVQTLLWLRQQRRAPSLTALPPEKARRVVRREAQTHAGPEVRVGAVRDLEVAGGAGSLRARHYAPERAEGAPLLLYLHGGGFVLGDLETYDPLCRLLCRHARVHVLAVEYRLAPEHRYPAAFHDALAAIAWAQENAAALGADPARVAIGGDSAGANLAASVTQQLRNARAKLPAAQLLLYPPVDRSVAWRSLELFAEGFFLTRNDIEVFHRHYVGERTAEAEPRVSSLCAGELGALPPSMVITAGFDPLRDEGEAYAAALRAAGSPVLLRRFDGLIHGFANMAGVSRSCREAVIELAAAFGAMLDTTQHGQQKRSAA